MKMLASGGTLRSVPAEPGRSRRTLAELTGLTSFPALATQRMRLRAWELADAAKVDFLCRDRNIDGTSDTTPRICNTEQARQWIARNLPAWDIASSLNWAVISLLDDRLVGHVGLSELGQQEGIARLSFWIGRDAESVINGVDCVQAVLAFAFTLLRMSYVRARHASDEDFTAKVLTTIGMRRQRGTPPAPRGTPRLQDDSPWGISKSEWVGSL